jgi:hypothetical protein
MRSAFRLNGPLPSDRFYAPGEGGLGFRVGFLKQ